jgi:hypothetical protein
MKRTLFASSNKLRHCISQQLISRVMTFTSEARTGGALHFSLRQSRTHLSSNGRERRFDAATRRYANYKSVMNPVDRLANDNSLVIEPAKNKKCITDFSGTAGLWRRYRAGGNIVWQRWRGSSMPPYKGHPNH